MEVSEQIYCKYQLYKTKVRKLKLFYNRGKGVGDVKNRENGEKQ